MSENLRNSPSIQSLIACGTKLWLDSIDPDLVAENFAAGATGATSNPIIVADLINSGRFDERLIELAGNSGDHEHIAWELTDYLVREAQAVFQPVWQQTKGNDGYVSFEIDPLLEDPSQNIPHPERVAKYVDLGTHWSREHQNRMIKVPATPAGIEALEPLAAAGVPLNVTLIFSPAQYIAARDAVWRGAQQRSDGLQKLKSAYSIFVSRIDVYAQQHCPQLTLGQGQVGIVNAKQIWQLNREFWSTRNCPLDQEIIFASTGAKNANDPPWKYVQALAGSDIQTNPPATNDAVATSGLTFDRQVDQFPAAEIVNDIYEHIDFHHMEETLMREGIAKFADPHKQLLELIREKSVALAHKD